jgi:hypothetical protein
MLAGGIQTNFLFEDLAFSTQEFRVESLARSSLGGRHGRKMRVKVEKDRRFLPLLGTAGVETIPWDGKFRVVWCLLVTVMVMVMVQAWIAHH